MNSALIEQDIHSHSHHDAREHKSAVQQSLSPKSKEKFGFGSATATGRLPEGAGRPGDVDPLDLAFERAYASGSLGASTPEAVSLD